MTRIEEIRENIKRGSASIFTAEELKRKNFSVREILDSVDVVTCGTCGIMSGTYAVLSVPVAAPGSFTRAEKITLNGVTAIPGPCPNERLGLVDIIVYGTAHASSKYGGGHLFHDIVAGREIEVSVLADGQKYETCVTKEELPHARLFTTRSAFKNYSAFTNTSPSMVNTIFSVLPLKGNKEELTVSGCGEINPLENDPSMRFLNPGTSVLLNGGPGYYIGTGTRSSINKPNMAVHGDMLHMDPLFCGGFLTSAGPECFTSVATAIPIIDEKTVYPLLVGDEEISLPIMDIANRQQIGMSTYDHVWNGTAKSIEYHPQFCRKCSPCSAQTSCPVNAIKIDGSIDQKICFVCGTCVNICENSVYKGSFGTLMLSDNAIPIVLRQSDRRRAEILCRRMREKILEQEVII